MHPEQLLKTFPQHLDNLQEAQTLLDEAGDISDLSPSDILTFNSWRAAFTALYPDSVDSFKREKCEDYNTLFSDFTDFYAEWLDENFSCYQLGKNKILIIK